jgi:Amt family ammonium transporter
MDHCGLDQGLRTARGLVSALRDTPCDWQGLRLGVGMSVGIVQIDRASPDLDTLWSRADRACYLAKAAPAERIHVWRGEADGR